MNHAFKLAGLGGDRRRYNLIIICGCPQMFGFAFATQVSEIVENVLIWGLTIIMIMVIIVNMLFIMIMIVNVTAKEDVGHQ